MPTLRNARHEKFAAEIVAGKSAAAAYRAAGLKADRRSAWRVRHRSDVVRRIDELQAQIAQRERTGLLRAQQRYNVSADRVVAELARIAFSNLQDYLRTDSNGKTYFDFAGITRDQGAAIAELIIDEYKGGQGDSARDVKRIRLKLADKRAALVDLGRHLGLFVDPNLLNVKVANYFTEKPPSLDEWRLEIEAGDRS
jgi:phage terminase small subunit